MKKLFLAILILSLSTVSVLSAKPQGYPTFTIGPRAGLNILTSNYSDYLNPGPQIGISGRKFFDGGLYAGGMIVYNTFG